ncbi:MAG: hypothetical protein AB7Q97_24705 [Gammaproteobacteria bacterium]
MPAPSASLHQSPRIRARAMLCAFALCLPAAAGARQDISRTLADPRAMVPPPASRLATLARHVAAAEPADRASFAVVALEELAQSYEEEAQAAHPDGERDAKAEAALLRWRAGTGAYARELRTLVAGIDDGADVAIFVDPSSAIRLSIGERQVILSSPRLLDPEPFEDRIRERFCELADCQAIADNDAGMNAGTGPRAGSPAAGMGDESAGPYTDGAADPPGVGAVWSFGDRHGPVLQTSAGIQFEFRSNDDLLRKRHLCLTLVAELQTLAQNLHYHRARGIVIDWKVLRLVPDPPSGRQRVLLNGLGQSLVLDLPLLQQAHQALEMVKPWLAARADDLPAQMPPIPAERVLAGLIAQ